MSIDDEVRAAERVLARAGCGAWAGHGAQIAGEAKILSKDGGRYCVYEQEFRKGGEWIAKVSFNVDWVPEDHREWLVNVWSRQLEDLVGKAYRDGRRSVQGQVKDALGL